MVTRKSSKIAKSRGAAAGGTRRLTSTSRQDPQQPHASVHPKDEEEIEVGGVTSALAASTAAPAAAASPSDSVAMPRLRQELYVQDSKARLNAGPQDAPNEKGNKEGRPSGNKRSAMWDADDAAAASVAPGAFHVSSSGGVDLLPDHYNFASSPHEPLHDVDLEEGGPSHDRNNHTSNNNHHQQHLIGAHLVEANLVTEEPSPILVKATPIVSEPPSTDKNPRNPNDDEPKSRLTKKSLWIIIVVLVVVCAAAIAVGIIWGVKRIEDNSIRSPSSNSSTVSFDKSPPSPVEPGSDAPSPPTAVEAPSRSPSLTFNDEGDPAPTQAPVETDVPTQAPVFVSRTPAPTRPDPTAPPTPSPTESDAVPTRAPTRRTTLRPTPSPTPRPAPTEPSDPDNSYGPWR